MSGSLDRNRIMKLFETLSARLAARGIRGQLYIVGGSAMIVGYGRERTTRDVDARIEYGKDEVLAAAEEIAAEENLDPNWLNENARLFMPPARDDRARTVFNTPGLVVTGASAEPMLAMKIDAARNSDEDDIGELVDQLGITSADQALEIYRTVLPHTAAVDAATGTRVEDRRREGEAPAVSDRPPKSRMLPSFRNCDSSPIHGGFGARRRPRFDTLSDTLRSGRGCDIWTWLDPEFENSLGNTRSAVRVRSPAPIESITYRSYRDKRLRLCRHYVGKSPAQARKSQRRAATS